MTQVSPVPDANIGPNRKEVKGDADCRPAGEFKIEDLSELARVRSRLRRSTLDTSWRRRMLIRARCEESNRTEQQAAGRQLDRLNRVEDQATAEMFWQVSGEHPMLRCCIDLRRNASHAPAQKGSQIGGVMDKLAYEIKNAVIESASITKADHGLLSAWLHLNYGGSGQGFGGYSLYLPKSFTHHDLNINYAGHFIFRVLEIAGVEEWKDLPGKTVRVKACHSQVPAIGHIVKDDWFCPKDDFAPFDLKSEEGVRR